MCSSGFFHLLLTLYPLVALVKAAVLPWFKLAKCSWLMVNLWLASVHGKNSDERGTEDVWGHDIHMQSYCMSLMYELCTFADFLHILPLDSPLNIFVHFHWI